MAELEPQDPMLAPDAEPTLGDDDSYENAPSLDETSEDTIEGSRDDPPVSSATKTLGVKQQTVKGALGNIGEFTGSIDVGTNFPHGQGEMIYSLPASHTNDFTHQGAAVPALVASHKGSWENGHWQGHGTQTLNNGDSFSGEFEKSLRTFGEYRWKEQELQQQLQSSSSAVIIVRKQRCYQGGFHESGRPHGHGKYTWTTLKGSKDSAPPTKSVSTYVGMFENGQRQGHGVFASPALHYTGDWEDGKYHGYGVLKIPSKKTTYRGQFHRGKRDGKGEEMLDDGTIVHEGLWREDRPVRQQDHPLQDVVSNAQDNLENDEQMPSHPVSTVFQKPEEIMDGENLRGMYKGIVEQSLPSGVGTITYEKNHHPAGIVQYEGFFDRGIRQGYGRATFGNGDTYQGNWANGLFEGTGEFTFANGRMYKGSWAKGLPHDSQGRFMWTNGNLFEGVFEHGHRKTGRFVFADGAYYDGEFFSPDGIYGGTGKLVTLMVTYEGGFRDGAFHGQGCLRKNSGFIVYEGEWKDGKAVRDDVLISIPAELMALPLPPPDDDFGEFDDEDTDTLTTLKRTISPTPTIPHPSSFNRNASEGSHPSFSETIIGTSSKLLGSLTSNFSGIGLTNTSEGKPLEEECKAVVDMLVSDAQENPGRYTGILHTESQRPHGVGRMVYTDGNRIHEGFWSRGARCGHGRCMFAKIGDYHEGEYKDNLRHGPGKYFWKDGRQYIGMYLEDERSGEGKFIYPNGDVYEGSFERGSRHGYGVFAFSQRTCEYRGDWKGSTYNGTGRLQWKTPNGLHVYKGEFKDGLFHGPGIETVNGVLKREGLFENGVYQADGMVDLLSEEGVSEESTTSKDEEGGDEDEDEDEQPIAAVVQESPSKDECPTTMEQNYTDVRLQWKSSLEPANT